MHEAGLANAIADAVRKAGPIDPGSRVRLLVSGGHAESGEFDDALRLHLRGLAPEIESVVEIEHVASDRLCMGCGGSFTAISESEPCPACGGGALPLPIPERIDIELIRPAPVG